MTDFAGLQSAFQRAILEGDESVLAELLDGPVETRAAMLGVYSYAYKSRLIDAIRKDHECLHAFLGEETFADMAAIYLTAHPSRHPNMRWVSQSLPGFLARTAPFDEHPVVAELAELEKALNDAFDAPDGTVVAAADLAAVPLEAWQDLTFVAHPSARRFHFTTNAVAIWSALHAGENLPELVDAPNAVIVWRHETTPMLRDLSSEEAMMWDEAANGIPFGQLCILLATFDDPGTAAARAAGYLSRWIAAGLLAQAVVT